ncbi:MAG: HAMP domain-containing protein [Clostridia bacterium]|nr:HAMP domain-containing protein [Clostridia bacterium]
MRRLPRFTRTIMAVLTVCVLLFTSMMYFSSGALARRTVQRMAEREAVQGVREGLSLLAEYVEGGLGEEALQSALSPAVNPAEVYLLLTDGGGALLAASAPLAAQAQALCALAASAEEETEIRQEGDRLLALCRGENGVAVAVKPLAEVNVAEGIFRSLMLQYALLGLAFMAVALLLLALRIMAPVDTLVDAAWRVSQGDEIEISEKLPVELRPLGRAFNQMSRRLSRSMQELTRERDTLSQVLESLDEGVLAVDAQGDILRENTAASALLGGRGSAQYAQVLSSLRGAAQEDAQMQIGERTVLAVFRPLASGDGGLAVLRDVTEHERLERTRRDYVANISHELRTPLSSMRGITEGLRDGLAVSEEERQRYYELLLSEVKRLSRLVNDLLELSNLQSSPASFSLERVDALETLYELFDRTQTLARQKGVKLVLDAPETLPTVETNEDRLQQVLTILLDNAVKFTPEDGTVTLGAAAESRFVRFFVRDTGIGMDEFTIEHAFDRFHQADHSHSRKGSGLGLAIAQEIMKRLDGHITVKSKPGEGSEFAFLVKTAEEAER